MEEIDYVDFSEALHSSYLFYTMEVDKLNKENKRLREALEKIAVIDSYKDCKNVGYEVDFVCCSKCQVNKTCIYYIAETTLRNTICD